MSNFEKITVSPETLGEFLSSLPIATGPWDESFHRQFCDSCERDKRQDCGTPRCPHEDNPLFISSEIAGLKGKEYHVLAGMAVLSEILTLAGLRRDAVCAAALIVIDISGNTPPAHEGLTEEVKRLCSGAEQAVFKVTAGGIQRRKIIMWRRSAGQFALLTVTQPIHEGGGEKEKKPTDLPFLYTRLKYMWYYHKWDIATIILA